MFKTDNFLEMLLYNKNKCITHSFVFVSIYSYIYIIYCIHIRRYIEIKVEKNRYKYLWDKKQFNNILYTFAKTNEEKTNFIVISSTDDSFTEQKTFFLFYRYK